MRQKSKIDLLYEEAQRTLDQQIERSEQLLDRAHNLLRIYILALSALGAILSAYLSNTNSTIPSINNLMKNADSIGLAMSSLFFGIFTIFVGIFALIVSISESTKERGPGSRDIRMLYNSEFERGESVQKKILYQDYIKWIKELSIRNHKRQKMLKYAYALSVLGIVMFSIFLMEVW